MKVGAIWRWAALLRFLQVDFAEDYIVRNDQYAIHRAVTHDQLPVTSRNVPSESACGLVIRPLAHTHGHWFAVDDLVGLNSDLVLVGLGEPEDHMLIVTRRGLHLAQRRSGPITHQIGDSRRSEAEGVRASSKNDQNRQYGWESQVPLLISPATRTMSTKEREQWLKSETITAVPCSSLV